jgi:hypothetical protein
MIIMRPKDGPEEPLTLAQPPAKQPASTGPNLEDAFLREVDEGVRRDQVGQLWKRYGVIIVVLVVGLLGGLAGWLWWQDQQARTAGAAGEQLTRAIENIGVGDNAAARPIIAELQAQGPAAYAAMARFLEAADQIAVGDEDKGAATLQAIADDATIDQPLRDAALLKLVRLQFDTMAPDDVVAKLKPLAVPGNPWFGLAGETVALAHIKAGTPEPAQPILTAIAKDSTLPASLRNRAGQLALSIGVEIEALGLGEPDADALAVEEAE